jgi:bla regulator protein blaR1
MTLAKYLSDVWATIAPAVGNHLWQSTLFAVVAGLLTLVLRKNQARARYALWLAASLKFLVPFSLLVGMGSHLVWSRGSDGVETGIIFAMDEFSQPFTQPTMPAKSHAALVAASPLAGFTHLLPLVLAAVWLCGFAAVLFTWLLRWRRMSAAIRGAVPLRDGREVEALRRLERAGGIQKRIEMFLSSASLEPGIFGISRPKLVWPQGISARLDDAHVEAILAHEVGHVRRRDNLFAAIHMLVEAIFWFHPLVWYLGTRLVEEREVACDEEVLALGSDRQIYAESILKICKFCVGSPLACVSGVTGADLKKRIVRVMARDAAANLKLGKKLLLSAFGLAAVAAPLLFGVAHATPVRAKTQNTAGESAEFEYEVVSVKPNKSSAVHTDISMPDDGLKMTNIFMNALIRRAYGVEDFRLLGVPNWARDERFDIEAKLNPDLADRLKKLSPDDRTAARQHMLQTILAQRFHLTIHRETRELPVYVLAIAKNGPKLQEAKPGDTYPNGLKSVEGGRAGPGILLMGLDIGQMIGQGVTTARLARGLSAQLGRPVVDKTGLTASYDLRLSWKDEDDDQADPNGASLFTAIQEQLGLKLESGKGPVEVIVVDRIERPSAN